MKGLLYRGGSESNCICRTVSQTVQMVTRKAMTQTLQGVVNKELNKSWDTPQTMEDSLLKNEGEVMEVVDELGETVELEVLILVDTSASMKHKFPTVKEALLDSLKP